MSSNQLYLFLSSSFSSTLHLGSHIQTAMIFALFQAHHWLLFFQIHWSLLCLQFCSLRGIQHDWHLCLPLITLCSSKTLLHLNFSNFFGFFSLVRPINVVVPSSAMGVFIFSLNIFFLENQEIIYFKYLFWIYKSNHDHSLNPQNFKSNCLTFNNS